MLTVSISKAFNSPDLVLLVPVARRVMLHVHKRLYGHRVLAPHRLSLLLYFVFAPFLPILAAHLRTATAIISSTTNRLVVIIEFTAHGGFNHAHLRRVLLHILCLVEVLSGGLELGPVHARLLQVLHSVFQHFLLFDQLSDVAVRVLARVFL